jgi:hypothetical protein
LIDFVVDGVVNKNDNNNNTDNKEMVSTLMWCYLYLHLAQLEDEAEKNQRKQQWKQRMLTEEGRRRRDKRYPRAALKFYNDSPFKYLYDSGNDQALLNACGVDHEEFSKLLDLFEPLY